MNLHPLVEPGWLNAILPELILSAGGMLVILWGAFRPMWKEQLAPLAIVILTIASWAERGVVGGTYFGGTYEISPITRVFDITFFVATMLVTLLARDYLIASVAADSLAVPREDGPTLAAEPPEPAPPVPVCSRPSPVTSSSNMTPNLVQPTDTLNPHRQIRPNLWMNRAA